MLAILHQETGVAYSRNSLPSPRGRPSVSLLDRGFKRVVGVPTTCINPSLFLSRLQLLSSANFLLCSRYSVLPRPVSAPAPLLVTLVAIPPPAASEGFLCSAGLRIVAPYTLVQSWVLSFLLIWKSDPSLG
jgi:hypothetical protein